VNLRTILLLGTLAAQCLPASAQTDLDPPFPRLATIYTKTGAGVSQKTDEGKRVIAKFNLYISTQHEWVTGGRYLKYLNPRQIDLIYVHSVFCSRWSARPDGSGFSIGATPYYLDLKWLLCYAGATLSHPVDTLTRNIPVEDLSPFTIGDYALIGGVNNQKTELVKITATSAAAGPGMLTVERGRMDENGKFPAIAHDRGDYVRAVAYAWKQGFLAFNMSAACPRSDINPGLGKALTYNQFLAAFWAAKIAHDSLYSNLDGVFLDNYVDIPSQLLHNARTVDYTNRNKPTPSPDNNDYWKKGMADLARQMRLRLPDKLITANTGGSADNSGAWLNGGMIEGVNQDGKNRFVGDADANPTGYYDSWMTKSASPHIFVYNASDAIDGDLETARTDYKAMRFLLTLTLLDDGYFDYDEFLVRNSPAGLNSGGHQSAWWYDEYDNAGRSPGYLGYPLGKPTEPLKGVFRRDFQKGIVLCNTTTDPQQVSLEKAYTKIAGTQDPVTNDGSTITSLTLQPQDGIILLSR
jgi:hypothetical protein